MKKILYVITKANWGGAQKYVFDLAEGAKAARYDVSVAYGESGLLSKKLEESHIRTIAVPALGRDVRTLSDIRAFFALLKIFCSERPDAVHLNSSKAGAMGALAARIAGIRHIIFTAHGWAHNEARPLYQKIPIVLLHYFCVLLSHKTVCVSQAIERSARSMPFVKRKLVLIHNGTEALNYITREDARTFLAKNGPIPEHMWIGTIAELHPNKRLDLLIEAFGRISTEFPDTSLVIMGEGQERRRLEDLVARRRLATRAHLLGHVADAPKYLRALDIFVLPSHTEALSLSILEAGMASLPVIASNVGGIPEIIEQEKTGLLFERGNVEQLTHVLQKLLASPEERMRLGTALKEKVESEFSLEEMVEKTLALYH